ncbi:NACHT domain-containing protein [Nostoc sphaeroides CHAB 2801]|uniref:NB-ARC domain-containing protein n=1 Tax=Nostoc sphaeroides TaxID=446679 RepID=UPI000E4819A9|nr:NB-ARC domain-containing protein [Nostoc sphaeroides]MCC5634094.1 NACHT domain-containing protein [Nostoc sphaeroides CHAB 2801]
MKFQQKSRRRGVILSPQGLQKLQDAKSELESSENFGKRYSREALGFRMGLDPDTVAKVFACEVGVDRQTLKNCFQAFNLQLERNDSQFANQDINPQEGDTRIQNRIDWEEAPDVSLFCGRTEELTTLKNWILAESTTNQAIPCRLITLWGMGGIGKTWLSVKLAQQLQEQFEFVIWRSLLPAPPVNELLADLITVFSEGKETDLPEQFNHRISRLIYYLQHHRCLLILDGADRLLEQCATLDITCRDCIWLHHTISGEYCELFRRVAETTHKSCLILTSRLKSYEITPLEGETRPARVFSLQGLQVTDIQKLFRTKGTFRGTADNWDQLIKLYAGNPHVLNRIATTIQQLFDGSITEFLEQKVTVFGRIINDLNLEFEHFSDTAKATIQSMALNHQPISFSQLRTKMPSSVSSQELLEALEILQARFWIDAKAGLFSLQPMIIQYVKLFILDENITKFQPSALLEQEHQYQVAS